MENKNQGVSATSVSSEDATNPYSSSIGMGADPHDLGALSLDPSTQPVAPIASSPDKSKTMRHLLRRADVALVVLLLIGFIILVVSTASKEPAANTNAASVTGKYDTQEIALEGFIANQQGVNFGNSSVVINGPLRINDNFVVSPSLQPNKPTAGQIYFDQNTNQLAYYNGTAFVPLSAQETAVQSIGGVSGALTLGGGLTVVGNQITATFPVGVSSFGGQTGAIAVGSGLALAGNTLVNSGVLNVLAGTNIAVSNDGNGNVTVSNTGAGTGTVTSGGGTGGTIPLFTGAQNIENSIITQSGGAITVAGNLSATGALTLGTALSVANGGTGTNTLAANGVLLGNGAAAISSVVAGGSGLCLMSTVGAPAFAACPGGAGGVDSLNGLTGALTIANASTAGSTVTINDATTAAKGIASFNATNFSVSSGAVNTIQDIDSGATPTFAGVNTNNITPSAALTIGISAQTALLQGSTTTITSSGAGNDIVLNSADTIELQDNTNVTGNIVTTGDVAVNGGDLTSSGALNITPGGALTAGASSQSLTLQGNASTSLRATNAGNTTIVGFSSPTANTTLNFPALSAGTYTICTTSGNCAGAGVTLQGAYDNSTNPEIVVDATRGALTIRDAVSAIGANLLEVQSNNGATTYLGVTAAGVTVTGTATVSGTINSSGGALQTAGTTRIDNSGNATNIGNLTLSGAISGGTSVTGSGNFNSTSGAIQTNSTTRIDNSGNLTNIGSISASGSATLQGGSVTLGTNAQAGSVIINDGSSNAGTLLTAALGQNTQYILPDPGGVSATICLSSGNCVGSGGGVSTSGGTNNRVAKFNGSQTITDSSISDDGVTVTTTADLAVNGGDISSSGALNITPGGALTVGISAQTALLQGSTTTITSSGAGNDIVLNSADTIELQDNTNVTGNIVTTGDITVNGGDLTSTGALNITPGGTLTAGASSQNLTLQGNASTSLRATNGANTTIVGFASPTANTTLNFPALSAGTYTICTTSGNCAGAGVTLQAAYDNSTSPEIILDATRGAVTIRDNATPLGANLLEVQNNGGGTTYLAVTASGIAVTGTAGVSGNINTTGGALQTNSTTRVDNSGNLTNIAALTLSGAISGGTSFTGSGNVNTTGGVIQTNSTTRIDNSGNLTNIGSITASGSATLQGGTLTLGTASQAATIVLNDGAGETGTIAIDTLGQTTTYTLPDPGVASADICLSTGNCASSGGGVTTAGGTTNRVAKFTGSQTIGDSIITDNGSTVTIAGVLAVNTITPTGAFTAGATGQTTALQGSVTTITSSGAGNDVVINSADTIELQDNTNVTGNLDVSGTLAAGTANAFQVAAGGDITTAGNAAIQGGTNTIGTAAQQGSLVLHDGNGETATISVGGGLAANTALAIPVGVGASDTFCLLTLANCSGTAATLQSAYNNSTSPEIVLDATRGAVTIRDNATPIGANLLEIQNNAGGTTYFAVTSTGIAVTGTVTASGNINTTGGALQTNTTTRIDNSGNATNIGNIGLSGSISGGTTYSGSGNINTTGGALQTNSTNRVDNSGNLVNIGNLTATGAITIASTGAGNDVIIDGADQLIVQDAAVFNGVGTFNTDVDFTLADTENINITSTVTGTNAVNLISGVLTNNTSSGTQQALFLQNAAGSGSTEALAALDNADTDTALANGLLVTSAAGGITTAIDVSDSDIVTALSFGANDIDGANFDITGTTGSFTSAGSGTLQGGVITLGTTSQAGSVVISDGSSNTGTIITAALGQNTQYTLPDPGGASANICLSTGNCAGAGGGVTGSGTNNRLTKFTSTGSTVGDSTITDNGTTVTTSVDVVIQGGDLTVGTTSQAGSLLLHDGNGQTTTIQAGDSSGNLTFIFPTVTGSTNQCLKQSGTGNQLFWDDCDGGAGGSSASLQSAYDTGNLINTSNSRDIDIELANDTVDANFDLVIKDGSTGYVSFSREDGAGTADPAQFLLIDNLDTTRAVPTGIKIQAAAGGITTGIDATDADIGTALAVGVNDIQGTTGNIDFTNFDVTGSNGNVTAGTYNGQTISAAASFTGSVAIAGNTTLTGDLAVNGGDITATGALNISSSGGTLVVGSTSQTTTLQGNAATTISADDSGNTTTVSFQTPTADVNYRFATASAGNYDVCTTSGNCNGVGVTLQSAYNASTSPEITLDATRGALTIRDNATPLGANLLEIQNNAGGTSYFVVTATGITVAGTAQTSGTINTTGGTIQTNSTNRIDNSGNLVNIGNLTLSGAISGGTTYAGSGNINTTGGALQTNSTTRVDNSGNLTNIGNITGTGAITIASSGAGNDIIINGADILDVQDAATFASTTAFNGVATFNTNVNYSLADAENIAVTNTVTGTTSLDLISVALTNNTTSGTQRGQLIQNTAGTGVTEALLVLDNADTDTAVTAGLQITSAAGTIQTAVDLSDSDIVDALNVGANNIIGTTGNIDFTNFDVTGSNGNVTAGTYNGQTISSAASFTGTVAVAGNTTLTSDLAVNGGDITSSGALNITPGGALVVGATGQSATLQGNASTTITATDSGNTTTVSFQTPTASVNYRFATASAGNYDVCTTAGNCSGAGVTLQSAYNASTNPEIVVDATRGALTVRDNATPIGANLLEVQSNNGATTYFGVTASGTSTTGTSTASGNINSTGGTLQTNSTTRIDNSGNATNIGNIGLSGTISGGTTVTGSGNFNTTGGSLQTNSITRVDNSGNLTNIGNLTATGAITIASTGAGNDVVIDGADQFIVQDAAVFNGTAVFNTDTDFTLADTENVGITNTVTGTNVVNLINTVLTNNTTGGSQQVAVLQNAAGSGVTEALLVLDNADTDTAVTTGLQVTSAAGAITTALDVSDSDIVDAINVGANNIVGTTGNLDFSNFDVVGSSGAVTAGTYNGQTITSSASFTGTLAVAGNTTLTGDLAVNGGDITSSGALNITPGGALVAGATGQTATVQGSITTITSNGAGNDIILNSADTIELQDNTNVTGSLITTGTATIQGASATIGTTSQQGSLVLHDGNGETATISVGGGLAANTALAIPVGVGASDTFCLLTLANCSGVAATLQSAYNNSTSPEIVLDATRGAVTIRDNATPLGANLLEIQNNAGGTTYFAVTSSGVAVTGAAVASGNINTTGGVLQTNSTTRIDNSGNATNIGNVSLSGSISGGTTVSGSGNFNTTGGALQTNSTTRVDNSGNLTNIGNLTATSAITIASTGAGNDVIIDGADQFIVQDAAVFNGTAVFNTDTDFTLADTENVSITNTVTGTNAVDLLSGILTNNTSSGAQRLALLQNAAGSGTTEALLALDNADTDTAVTTGLQVTSAAGAITTALDVSDSDIVDAINVGANNIVGTTGNIDLTNFDVVGSSGNVTAGTYNGQTITSAASFTGTLAVAGHTTLTGDLAVNGGDLTSSGALNITPGGALVVGATGQSATVQGSITTITSTGAGNDIILNSADTIELQDNTNVTGNFVASGTAVIQGASATVGTTSQQGSLVLHDGNGQTATVSVGSALAGNTALAIPTAVGASDTFCLSTLANCLGGAGGGANTALSNLQSVAINTSLLSGSATIDLGSGANPFRDLYLGGTATNNFRFTGTASAARTYTLDDLSGRIALVQTAGSSSAQTGDVNVSGTLIAGTALQGTLVKTADGAGASSALTLRSGTTTGGSGLSTGAVTLQSGNGSGTNTSSGSVTIDSGAKTGSGTNGAVSIGATNASGVSLGRSGTTTSVAGTFTVSNGASILNGPSAGSGTVLTVNANAASNVGLVINGASSQSANLLTITDGAAVPVVSVNSVGSLLANYQPTGTGSTGSLELGSTASQSAGDINGTIGFYGVGAFHAEIAYSVGDGFYLCNASSGVGGDYGQCTSRVNLYGQNADFNGTALFHGGSTSTSAFQIQDTGSASMFNANTTTRTSGVAGNMIKIGDSTGTDTALTVLQLDATSANPTTNLASLNGGLFYHSGNNKVSIIENGVVKELCNKTDLACGAGATTSLQDVYDDSTDPEITLTSSPGGVTIRDNSTPIGGNLFEIQNNARSTTYLGVSTGGVSVGGVLTLSGGQTKDITTASAGSATALILQPGDSTAANGTGAAATIKAGDASSTSCGTACTGGALVLQAGSATGASGTTRNGGDLTLNAGTGATNNGTLTVGSLTGTNIINVGSAVPASSATQTINIGNASQSNAGSVIAVNILSGAAGSNGTATLSLANNDRVTQVDIGNVAADAARTLNMFTGNSGVVDTINIGTGNGTVAGAKTIHIGDGAPTGSGTNLITIGSVTALANSTTIQGGNGASAIQLLAAASGTITVGTTTAGTANTVNINNATNAGTVSVGAGMTTGTIAIGGASQTGTITVGQATTSQTLNIGAAQTATGNTLTVNMATSATGTGKALVTIGNTNDGSALTLQAGTGNVNMLTNSASASVIAKSQTNGSSAFMVQNSSGNAVLGVDTTNAGAVSVTARAAPTTDLMTITNAGQAVATANANGLKVNYVGGAAAVESAGIRVDLEPGGTTGGTWSGLRIVANATGAASGVSEYGIKLEGPSSPGAGTETAINITTGWDVGLAITSGGIQMGDQADSTVTAPSSGNVKVYTQSYAGKMLLKTLGPNGGSSAVQAAVFTKKICEWRANFTDMHTFGCDTNGPEGSSQAEITGQVSGQATRDTSAATSGAEAGWTGSVPMFFRGSTAGANGFFYSARIYFPDASYGSGSTGVRWFAGMGSTDLNGVGGADAGNGHYSAIQYSTNRGDTNLMFVNRDGTTQSTPASTGIAFTAQHVYDIYLYTPPQGTTVFWRVDDLTAGTTASGSGTSNLPGGATALAPMAGLTTLTTTARQFAIQHMYVESDR